MCIYPSANACLIPRDLNTLLYLANSDMIGYHQLTHLKKCLSVNGCSAKQRSFAISNIKSICIRV